MVLERHLDRKQVAMGSSGNGRLVLRKSILSF